MRLLVLGGTRFVGRHLVQEALGRGHEVTLFNRGSRPELFPEVEQLVGDRDGDVTVLVGRRWDAVIDVSGYTPRQVKASAELLADAVDHYTFISTVSVYARPVQPFSDEDAPLAEAATDATDEVTAATYGPLKVRCEEIVGELLTGRALVVRPGVVVGPHDPSDRFSYWPWRYSQGGEMLAPDGPELAVQFIDARDLAHWVVDLIMRQVTGVFNTVRPAGTTTLGDLFRACREATSQEATVTWVEEKFLLEQGVKPFADLPLWLPEARRSLALISSERASAAGLRHRPLVDTVADTLAWLEASGAFQHRAGLTLERERALLAAWHSRQRK
jgi:2'-hydroxyisoflavone reductase